MINQQSAARSTSSTKRHKHFFFLSAAYQHDRLHLAGKRLQQRSQGPQQQQSLPSSEKSSRGKKQQTRTMRYGTNAYHSLFFFVDAVDFYYDRNVAQIDNRRNDYFFEAPGESPIVEETARSARHISSQSELSPRQSLQQSQRNITVPVAAKLAYSKNPPVYHTSNLLADDASLFSAYFAC